MDVNEALQRMRAIALFMVTLDSDDDVPDSIDVELAQLVLDLHEWISKGGFLPDAWKVTK